MTAYLTQLKQRHLRGEAGGLFAVCSAHPLVLRTAMEMAVAHANPLLIEATANQVNQSGGYTGMTPARFATFVYRLAAEVGLPQQRVILGADHLGPHVWRREPSAKAMQKAEVLISQCVEAGFQKLHLDTATGCEDDPSALLPVDVTAERAARLCQAAEESAHRKQLESRPLYIIGHEVPTPGGGLIQGQDVAITESSQLAAAIAENEKAFQKSGLSAAWHRVMAVVVQPGVDFGDHTVAAYQPERAQHLSQAHAQLPGIMTYEIHATDFQTPAALKQMVQDHFLLLKVGPALTFAMRRALYALAQIEDQLPGIERPSQLIHVMERLMTARPGHWQTTYQGDAQELEALRHGSLRDRIRYYWSYPEAQNAVAQLIENLQQPLPAELVQEHLPDLFSTIHQAGLDGDPVAMVQLAIQDTLRPYMEACWRS
ncbi:MAG: class II D-tagatose-bisphosphate aldolase, non-catalytic subunit [Desulfobacteraceae bacterium]|nr:class II D-tagatose-bisphosphate aldolase, non-catalytic subunit [Desulfobacteraceae bacterium]